MQFSKRFRERAQDQQLSQRNEFVIDRIGKCFTRPFDRFVGSFTRSRSRVVCLRRRNRNQPPTGWTSSETQEASSTTDPPLSNRTSILANLTTQWCAKEDTLTASQNERVAHQIWTAGDDFRTFFQIPRAACFDSGRKFTRQSRTPLDSGRFYSAFPVLFGV